MVRLWFCSVALQQDAWEETRGSKPKQITRKEVGWAVGGSFKDAAGSGKRRGLDGRL